MRRALALLVLLLPAIAAAQGLTKPTPLPPRHPWQVTLFQIDKTGTLLGNPKEFPCTPTGCERIVVLDVGGKPYNFLLAITVIPNGAYFALQSQQPEISTVVGFEEGFVGPTFLQLRQNTRFNTTLRFTLAGTALAESDKDSAQVMKNESSLVFHRKLTPDMILKLSFAPGTTEEKKPDAQD